MRGAICAKRSSGISSVPAHDTFPRVALRPHRGEQSGQRCGASEQLVAQMMIAGMMLSSGANRQVFRACLTLRLKPLAGQP